LNILYVSQYFPPEMGAPAARVAELSRLWTKAGHQLTVLTGFPNHPTGIVPPDYRKKLRRLVYREQIDGVEVVRSWLLPLPNRKSYERILNYSSFSLSAAMTGMFVAPPDVVIASSPQLLVGLSGWWLAWWKRAPFILEVRDLWPESLLGVGTCTAESLLYRALTRIAGFLYRACDQIVVVTPAFKQHLISEWQIDGDKISIVTNGVDANLFNSRVGSAGVREMLQAEGKFVVSYIGTLGMAHGLDTVIEAAFHLKNSSPNILFLLVGEGAEKEKIVSRVRERRLTNVRFVGQQAREHIPAYICASDACLVPLKKSAIFNTVLPTKLLEFMSCARPVIVGVNGLAKKLVDEANAGICIEPENPAALESAISRLAADPALCEELGRNGRRLVLQSFSRAHTAEEYLRVLEDVLQQEQSCAAAA
jgi:colanic acid biosynthesis glycosyl transferase WcaI